MTSFQVYIESKLAKCVRVRSGDRLGVYIEEAPGAIAYTFNKDRPQALLVEQNASDPIQLKDFITIEKLNFPYVFSLSAYIDTNMTLYNNTDEDFPPCPAGLLIPPYGAVTLPATTPMTARPGATGPKGDAGAQGEVGSIGEVGPKGDAGSPGETGLVGSTGPSGFNGSVGATGDQGPAGVNGSAGEKGETGFDGDVGATGARGPAGPTVTVQDPNALQSVDEDDGMFGDPDFVMALFIWLIVLTVLLLIFIIVVAVLYRRRRRSADQRQKTGAGGSNIVYSDRVQSHVYENDPKWISDMKEETETNYSNNTLTADGKELTADGKETTDERPTSFDYTNEVDKQYDYVDGEPVKAGVTQC